VVDAAIDLYRAGFVARVSHEPDAVRADGGRVNRLLATDDRGYGSFVKEVTGAVGEATVFERASRCDAFVRGQPGWTADRPAIAMVLHDIQAVSPNAGLPGGLVLQPVNRRASEMPNGVALDDAVAVAIASDPGIAEPASALARFLAGVPSSVRLLAAVDCAGVARATSGCEVFGEYARIFFVNTEPGWRRRGIGCAMTAEALRAAAVSGARRAFLHATNDGAAVYTRLGFEVAGRVTRYSRPIAAPPPLETGPRPL
jgi:ribosomal protein S18 acetylase RimI-like enzyme